MTKLFLGEIPSLFFFSTYTSVIFQMFIYNVFLNAKQVKCERRSYHTNYHAHRMQ